MQREARRKGPSRIWVPVVLLIGLAAGLVLAAVPLPSTTATSPGHGPGIHLQLATATDFDVILSTVGIALLLALTFVYAGMYAATKASFALGLVVVLLALLLESVLSSPLVYGAFGEPTGTLGTFLAFADGFKIVAFTVLLYLSLE